jgi:hypothetical protein
MALDKIECPKCKHKFPVADALLKEIESSVRAEANAEWAEKEEEYKQAILDGEKAAEETLKKVRVELEESLRKKITSENAMELKDLKASLKEKEEALETANEKELAHLKEVRELKDLAKNAMLDAEHKLDSERVAIVEKAAKDAETAHSLKDLEKDTQLVQLKTQLEDMKRKLESGSQQLQGESFELKMEEMLRAEFPLDEISEVAKGVTGGDIIITVKTRSGVECGKILLELKRTKSFSASSWLPKLKNDMRNAHADLCVLISETMPEGIEFFTEMQGVWVSSIKTSIALIHILRAMLLKVAGERSMQEGKADKAALLYTYIISTEFKNRIEAIIEHFKTMHEDLSSEKRAMEKIWSKRDKQIQQILLQIAGFHGEIKALSGSELPDIKSLELKEE